MYSMSLFANHPLQSNRRTTRRHLPLSQAAMPAPAYYVVVLVQKARLVRTITKYKGKLNGKRADIRDEVATNDYEYVYDDERITDVATTVRYVTLHVDASFISQSVSHYTHQNQ